EARLRRYEGDRVAETRIADLPGGYAPPRNAGFEALARDRAGRLYTLPERPPAGYGPMTVFPLYRLDPADGAWTVAARLTHDRDWLAVGADFGPDGAFYLLERRFGGLGFASRIRRFQLDDTEGVTPGALAYRSPLGRHGNLEGIGIWRDAAGRLRAVMVSDDNHKPYQRSEIVEVTLPALASAAAGQ
ncbi:MAG: esterase-like activity of phytase family protein, partial [Deinococcus-Thermus bacterium]|nr:esterase-like activity of phytase family protein [Deinococcota bacterium]